METGRKEFSLVTKIANGLDDLRIIPRVLIGFYMYLVMIVSTWYMALPDPSAPQATFISIVFGASAAWFGLYVNTKRDGK